MTETVPASKDGISMANKKLSILERGDTNSKLATIAALGGQSTKSWHNVTVSKQKDSPHHTIDKEAGDVATPATAHYTINKLAKTGKDEPHHTVARGGGNFPPRKNFVYASSEGKE